MIVFNRHTACQVEELPGNQARVSVSMCDTYHDISVVLLVELPVGKILDARADFLRVPDQMCRETAGLMSGLVGEILGRGIRKNALRVLGGSKGCVHLTDLVIEAAKALLQGKYTILLRDYDDFDEGKGIVSGKVSCYYHTENAKKGK